MIGATGGLPHPLLARWLLICADRIPDGDLTLTHKFLAMMLNVRRALA